MISQKKYWDERFKFYDASKPKYDLWLDKYDNVLSKSRNIPIIDLGCGFGNDTLYLSERGYKVISCDFSEEALKKLYSFIDNPNIRLFDLRHGLPFENKSAKIIISDLSLHYFYWVETQIILKEISRVLMEDGIFLCRVNSTNDVNYGAGTGIKLEENYFDVDGSMKRFFDRMQIDELFSDWEIEYINECEMLRYEKRKIVWEIAAKKHLNDSGFMQI